MASSKIIADVSNELKQKLADLAHAERCSMKDVLIKLIEKEYAAIKPGEKQND